MGLYVFNKHAFPAFFATLREFHLLSCCLFYPAASKKNVLKSLCFSRNFRIL